MKRPNFASPKLSLSEASTAFEPIKKKSVSEAVQESLIISQSGGYLGAWSPDETPYMLEPMNMLASRSHEAVCFVGPARSGKTLGLLDGWMTYTVTCNPGDMLIVQMSQDKAREYSKTRIDRAIRHSKALSEKMSSRGHNDNTHDKLFNNGMWLKIGWPSATQLSGSDYRYVGLTDYDRMPDNVDGEGSAYALGVKRTQTFLSRGMCMVESSPGRIVTDLTWKKATLHEAPPTNGVLGIYNRSDRRMWYWPCLDCFVYFLASPGLGLFASMPELDELLEVARKDDLKKFAKKHSKIACPYCGSIIDHKYKHQMNKRGIWLADGQRFENGEIVGHALESNIAGYWLGGVSASYQKWDSLILRYMQGLREYALSGAEETLKSTINTDQGMPYTPMYLIESADNEMENKAEELERYFVPEETRVLIASVDIQNGKKGRFVVQVHAVGVGMEQWIVDRFDIAFNETDGTKRRVEPGVYSSDWDLLINKVINASYKTPCGQKMYVHLTAIDTGGSGNTTDYAYQFYRRLAKDGFSKKVMLVKGGSRDEKSPIVRSSARDSRGEKMSDVPLYILNVSSFKDKVQAMISRDLPGGLMLHFPSWLSNSFYEELKAEAKDEKGRWKKIRERNESLDLCVYILACIWKLNLNSERFNWDRANWSAPLEKNINVVSIDEARILRAAKPDQSKPKRKSSYLL